jgi:hypothetical protein
VDVKVIRDYLHKQPFQPFTMRLADGRHFFVPHPDFVAVSTRTVVVIGPETEAATVLEPFLIISLEMPGEQAAGKSAGTN